MFGLNEVLESGDNNSNENKSETNDDNNVKLNSCDSWSPSGYHWKDFLHFAGPGWLVSIAYVDPGNYQADIQAGATSEYSLLCLIWWASILSIFVQILCVRLAYYGGLTLAEVQAKYATSDAMRYFNWFIAEFSTVITDLPEVIGIGIALRLFFNWPYWIGVVLSLLTTMLFLLTVNHGIRTLEIIIACFVGIMGMALFVEMGFVGVNVDEMMRGWTIGMIDLSSKDTFTVLGVVGAVVMPHNLYLHSGACKSHTVSREYVEHAVFYSSFEPIFPILISFFINLAVVCIAARSVYGTDNAENVGLTDFCEYFQVIASGGCVLWGIALLAAGQSSAITTTYTGQYVMDGFLNLQLSITVRAILTRLVAITPCVIVSILFPTKLNQIVNIVNAMLSFLLPFAFTPLVKFNCNTVVMGKYATKGVQKLILHIFAFFVWLANAIGLSVQGGGFFGDLRKNERYNWKLFILECLIQIFYACWNFHCITYDIQSESTSFVVNDHDHRHISSLPTNSDLSSDKEKTTNSDLFLVVDKEREII